MGNVLLLLTVLSCVILSGKHGRPRGRALCVVWTEILLFVQMDAAGTASTPSWLHFVLPRVSTVGPSDLCSDENVFVS